MSQTTYRYSANRSSRLEKVHEVGFQRAKLCVVVNYHFNRGFAFVTFRDYSGQALLTQSEIFRAGWTEVAFGNFLVCDIEQNDGKARATNARAATDADFAE